MRLKAKWSVAKALTTCVSELALRYHFNWQRMLACPGRYSPASKCSIRRSHNLGCAQSVLMKHFPRFGGCVGVMVLFVGRR